MRTSGIMLALYSLYRLMLSELWCDGLPWQGDQMRDQRGVPRELQVTLDAERSGIVHGQRCLFYTRWPLSLARKTLPLPTTPRTSARYLR